MSQLRRLVVPLFHPGNLPARRGTVGIVLIVALFAGAAALGLVVASQHHGVGPTARTFTVTVSNGHMSPDRMQVNAGDQVVLSITGDQSETVVLQGYQQQFELIPGLAVAVTFVAGKPGTFDFVVQGSNQVLGRLEVAA